MKQMLITDITTKVWLPIALTRIVFRRAVGSTGGKTIYDFCCDNGEWYQGYKGLSSATGVSSSSLIRRIGIVGYTSPCVLSGLPRPKAERETRLCANPKCVNTFDCRPKSSRQYCSKACGYTTRDYEKSSELYKIPNEPRGHNLKSIPSPGTWEATQ